MGSPGQNMITDGKVANATKARWNRAGVPVDGFPDLITVSDPPESYAGAAAINSPERVDLVVSRRDKTRVNIKWQTIATE